MTIALKTSGEPRTAPEALFEALFRPMGVDGVYGRTGAYEAVVEALAGRGVLGGVPASRLDPGRPELNDLVVVASTEVNTDEDRAAYAAALAGVLA